MAHNVLEMSSDDERKHFRKSFRFYDELNHLIGSRICSNISGPSVQLSPNTENVIADEMGNPNELKTAQGKLKNFDPA